MLDHGRSLDAESEEFYDLESDLALAAILAVMMIGIVALAVYLDFWC